MTTTAPTSSPAPSSASEGSGDPTGRAAGPTVRPARRHQRPGWRDPRILVGVVILAVSMLLGAKLLAGADDTVGVWALTRDLPAGSRVGTGELERVQVRFSDAARADRYLSADGGLPSGTVLSRPVGAGEMLPRDALTRQREALVEVPVSVEVDQVPATVRQGSVVDVWVTPTTATTADRLADAIRVLHDVVVVAAPRAADSLAPSGTRQVIVGVSQDDADDLGPALGKLSAGRVLIVRQD